MKRERGRIIPSAVYPGEKPRAKEDAGKLSRDEMRRLLAQMVRLNPAECFDESGAMDLGRVREIAGVAIQQMVVHESTRTTQKGAVTVQRKITLRLVDKVRAMRLDESLLEREEAEQAEEMSGEQKKEYEAAQRRAKALIKWKLLSAPGTPQPTFDKDGYVIEEETAKAEADASDPPPASSLSSPRPPPPHFRTEGRERIVE